jgi:uncharacterized protein (TIGR02300 family)
VGKPELGTKRACPSCGTKYYDLNRSPIVCPSCGTVFQVAATHRAPERVAKAAVVPEPVAEIEREEGVISLEEVEEPDVAEEGDEPEEAAVAEIVVEGEEAVEAAEDDTFLEEEEEEGDDVSNLLDVDAEEEDER